jgi:hypothetical protein
MGRKHPACSMSNTFLKGVIKHPLLMRVGRLCGKWEKKQGVKYKEHRILIGVRYNGNDMVVIMEIVVVEESRVGSLNGREPKSRLVR